MPDRRDVLKAEEKKKRKRKKPGIRTGRTWLSDVARDRNEKLRKRFLRLSYRQNLDPHRDIPKCLAVIRMIALNNFVDLLYHGDRKATEMIVKLYNRQLMGQKVLLDEIEEAIIHGKERDAYNRVQDQIKQADSNE